MRLTLTTPTGKQYAAFVSRKLRSAHKLLRSPLKELSLVFVGDQRMSRLHQEFMSITGPTDVLTFPLDTDPRGRATDGEVIVCIPEARRQAARHTIPVAHEVLLYAVHGLLHLSGFDDRTKADFTKMHRMEDHILTQLGVGRVFAPLHRPTLRRLTTGAE